MTEVSLVVLLNDEGEVLAVSRKNDHKDFGLVGGKVEITDSSKIDAAVREAKEETGLDIRNLKCIYQQSKNDVKYNIYLADWSGNIHTNEPHIVKWTVFDTINNGSFGERNKVVTEILLGLGYDIKLLED